jgi:hypothetical protein
MLGTRAIWRTHRVAERDLLEVPPLSSRGGTFSTTPFLSSLSAFSIGMGFSMRWRSTRPTHTR